MKNNTIVQILSKILKMRQKLNKIQLNVIENNNTGLIIVSKYKSVTNILKTKR